MKSKKVLLKVFQTSIFCIALTFLLSQGKVLLSLISGFVLACIYIFYNIFEYEKYMPIYNDEFLESKHQIILSNTPKHQDKIQQLLDSPFTTTNIKDNNAIEITIQQKLRNSYLRIEIVDNKIHLTIKRTSLSFLPDRAENYKLLLRVKDFITIS